MAILAIVIIVAAHVSFASSRGLASWRRTGNGEYEAHAIDYSSRHDGPDRWIFLSSKSVEESFPWRKMRSCGVWYDEVRGVALGA